MLQLQRKLRWGISHLSWGSGIMTRSYFTEDAKMFKAHYLLEEYSKSEGVKIWNCSSDTFLDAYERKTYSENKEVK